MKRANKFRPAKPVEVKPEPKPEPKPDVMPVEAAPVEAPVRHERYFHPERKIDQ